MALRATRTRAFARVSLRAALALSLFASGCKKIPKPGEACTPGQGVCVDATSMTACIGGVFVAMPCHGATGCKVTGSVLECDNSLSSVGDVCDEIGDYACAADRKAALSCQGNRFVVAETCKGPHACALTKDGLSCDNDVADLGDPCHAVGDFACTRDGKLALKCGSDHTMALLSTCKGTDGCRVREIPEEKRVEFVCDDAVADPNDACDEDGEEACTTDRRALLRCESGKFAVLQTCAAGCSFDPTGEKFVCEQGSAVAPGAKKPAKRSK